MENGHPENLSRALYVTHEIILVKPIDEGTNPGNI